MDWTNLDGYLRAMWSYTPAMPQPPKPANRPWFSVGFTMLEPESLWHLTKENVERNAVDVPITYRLPDNWTEENFLHTTVLNHPAKFFNALEVPDWHDRRFNISAMSNRYFPHRKEIVDNISQRITVEQFGQCAQTASVQVLLPEVGRFY